MNRQVRTPRGLRGFPEFEAMKAMCRDLGHHEAVLESAHLTDQYRRMWEREAPVMVDLTEILSTLRAKKIPFVLTGAHGISGWTGRPRSTQDIDLLVKAGRNHARAVKAISALYPQLEARQVGSMTRFFVPGQRESVIDVVYPLRADIEETLRTAVSITDRGLQYRIPTLEAALANKYGAMLTITRDPGKRGQDGVDFYFMVRHSTEPGRQPIDLDQLRALGEKVWPGGGGAEILRLVEEAKAGELPVVDRPEEPNGA